MKKDIKNLAQLTFPTSYETTMGQSKVLTIYQNLHPVMKVEGPEDLLDVLIEVLEEEKQKLRDSGKNTQSVDDEDTEQPTRRNDDDTEQG